MTCSCGSLLREEVVYEHGLSVFAPIGVRVWCPRCKEQVGVEIGGNRGSGAVVPAFRQAEEFYRLHQLQAGVVQ